MSHLKFIKSITAILLVVVSFYACKKDAFSEKDAIAAQTSLLQTKFSYDLSIKQVELQIQRSGDSAKIVIQNLINSGATALEVLKQTNALAVILQNQNNLLAQYRYQDSLNRNSAVISDQLTRQRRLWDDSIQKSQSNAAIAAALQKNYSLTFTDFNTGLPISGATVTVLPFNSSTVVTATTNAQGVANFTALVVDPGAFFSISKTGYGTILLREASLSSTQINTTISSNSIQTITKFNASPATLYNSGNTRNTIKGSILGDVNLTNGDVAEAISGQLVTFTNSITTSNGITTIYQFSGLSDASGNYSVSVPDGTFTAVYAPTINVQQKLFVSAWTSEDQTSVLPRIDSTNTTLQASFGTNISNGTATAIYYTFTGAADTVSVTKPEFAVMTSANNQTFFPGSLSSSPIYPFVARTTGTPRTDSIGNPNASFQAGINLYLNNQTVTHTNENQFNWSLKSKYLPAITKLDTLTVTLVSLVPGWIVTAPKLIAPIDGNTGKIANIYLARNAVYPLGGFFLASSVAPGAGGVFNPAAMYTASNRGMFNNLSGFGFTGATSYPASLSTINNGVQATNSTSFNQTISGGNTYYLPIEYRTTIARDKTPR